MTQGLDERWPAAVQEIYRSAYLKLQDNEERVQEPIYALRFDIAHIVWEDYNFDRGYLKWCLTQESKLDKESLEIVHNSLRALLELDDETLDQAGMANEDDS